MSTIENAAYFACTYCIVVSVPVQGFAEATIEEAAIRPIFQRLYLSIPACCFAGLDSKDGVCTEVSLGLLAHMLPFGTEGLEMNWMAQALEGRKARRKCPFDRWQLLGSQHIL